MLITKVGDYLLSGKNDVQDITVDGTWYYLTKDNPKTNLPVLDLSKIPPYSSIHVTGEEVCLYYTPACELTIYGTKDVVNLNVADAVDSKDSS